MYSIIDRLLLLVACSFMFDLKNEFQLSLTVMLVALSVSEFNIIFKKNYFYHFSTISYLVLCVFFPPFSFLLPLVLYESMIRKGYVYLFLGAVEYVYMLQNISTFHRFYFTFMIGFMIILFFRSTKAKKLHSKCLELEDSSRQLSIVMESRNREIQANQDSQIHLATLQERNRIAREIHDNVGHMLSRSILMVGASLAINKDENMQECLEELKKTLDQAMNSIRSSVHDLHDDSIDLKENVKQLVSEFTFCKMTLDYDMSSNVDRKVKLCILAILKEASSNIIKHSNATNVEVVLREHPGIYQLLIHDNGTTSINVSEDGIGLSNMEERVQGLKGTITINKENGYRIFVMIPKNNNINS